MAFTSDNDTVTSTASSAGSSEIVKLIRSNVIGSRSIISTPFGKREIVYADYTASGRCLKFIEGYMMKVVAPSYANTHTEASATGAQTTHLREEARNLIRKAVNAPSDEYAVLFTGSGATGAIDKLFRVLGFGIPEYADKKWNLSEAIPEAERPVVFVSHYEHHSNELIWRESIARCVVIREGPGGTPDLAHLERELLKYRQENVPMIGSFSAGSNVTGIRSPVRSICKLLHQFGAYAFFDYAGVGAYVKVDIKGDDSDSSSSMDAAFFSPHKFIGGPGSSGLLIARNELFHKAFDIETSMASTPGGGTIDFVSRRNQRYSRDIEYREDAGTPGILQAIKAGLAFKVKEMVGVKTIEKLEHVHCTLALNAWRSNPYIALMGSDRVSYQFATRRVSIFSFNLLSPIPTTQVAGPRTISPESIAAPEATDSSPRASIAANLAHYANVGNVEAASRNIPLHHNFVIALLNDVYGIQGRGGCSCAGPYGDDLFGLSSLSDEEHGYYTDLPPAFKVGWARVNVNYFISQHEVWFIIEAVKQIAQNGWRLLPQYVQDLKSGQFIHRSLFDADGKKLEASQDDVLFSINDLTLSNDTKAARGDGIGVRVTFRKPDSVIGERSRTSYRKVLIDAETIYKQASTDVKQGGVVRDFVADLSSEIKPGDVWWLLPTQAAAFLENRDAQLIDPAYATTDTPTTAPLGLKSVKKEMGQTVDRNSNHATAA